MSSMWTVAYNHAKEEEVLKESEIQKSITKALAKMPDVAWHTVNTTGIVKQHGCKYTVGKWFRSNTKNEKHDGLSDLTGMTITGQFFAIEVKRKGKEPTDAQWEFINFVIENGGLAGYATNVQEAEKIIRGFEIRL